ncbi:MAG: hypothetical protein AAFV69_05780 [Pseudomonadota bacterium]
MLLRALRPATGLVAFGLAMGLVGTGVAVAQDVDAPEAPKTYDVVAPPDCTNNKGEVVTFVDREGGRRKIAAGMARRDGAGKPVVLRSNFATAPPVFQGFVDRHECAHHQTGDVDRPHPPRNGPEHLMNESISDCIAIMRLRDEQRYDKAGLDKVAAAMRNEMTKIGFPEISISSRISNITNCFKKTGTHVEYINTVLKRRGLLEQ